MYSQEEWKHLIHEEVDFHPPGAVGLAFRVRVLDVRVLPFGRVDLLIMPVQGTGEEWIELSPGHFTGWQVSPGRNRS